MTKRQMVFSAIAAVAVLAVAAAVIFVVEERRSGDDNSASHAQGSVSFCCPPTRTATPLATLTPAPPLPTPPAIDTSAWLTYTSPHGFTIKYPPDWVVPDWVVENGSFRVGEVVPEGVVIEGGFASLPPGTSVAWIEISKLRYTSEFDIADFTQRCLPDTGLPSYIDGTREPSVVQIAGQTAVYCQGQGKDESGIHTDTMNTLSMALPTGGVLTLVSHVWDGDTADFDLVLAIISSLSFETGP